MTADRRPDWYRLAVLLAMQARMHAVAPDVVRPVGPPSAPGNGTAWPAGLVDLPDSLDLARAHTACPGHAVSRFDCRRCDSIALAAWSLRDSWGDA